MSDMGIDFDEAQKAWRANKKYVGNGCFVYKCFYYSINKKRYCKNPLQEKSIYCKFHGKSFNNLLIIKK
jgi:hypothetical protein